MKTSIFLAMSFAIISCGKGPYHGGTVVDSKAKSMVITEKTVETQVTYLSELYPNSIVVEYLKSEQGPGVDQPFEVKNSTGRHFKAGDTLTIVEIWWDGFGKQEESYVK